MLSTTIKVRFSRLFFILMLTLGFVSINPQSAHAGNCGDLLVAGSSWLGGNGVNVYSNGNGNCGGGSAGYGWQCVDLAYRLYQSMGWGRVYAANNNAYQIPEGSPGLQFYGNGSYTPVPGDLIIEYGTGYNRYGHVVVVNWVDLNVGVIHAIEQNTQYYSGGWRDHPYHNYPINESQVISGGYGVVRGTVHSPSNPFTNVPPGPPPVPWHFENLEGDPGSISRYDGNVGQTPTLAVLGTTLHGFYRDATTGPSSLRHAWADSTGWHFDVLDGKGGGGGRVSSDTGYTPKAIVYNGSLYVFYFDNSSGDLRLAQSDPSTSNWSIVTLDGSGGTDGRINSVTGQFAAPVVSENLLQVFYYDTTGGNLRHAWFNGTTWSFEDLDGSLGSVSRSSSDTGFTPSVVSYNGTTQVFYYDRMYGNLRHAWSDANGWHFENLDGDVGSIGRSNADLGVYSVGLVFNDTLQLFYTDLTNTNLRHAWSDSSGWHFENLDGDSGSIARNEGMVGKTPSALVYNGGLQLLYYDESKGGLRHAWNDTGGWHFEDLDGSGGQPTGRSTANVGFDPAMVTYNGMVQTLYVDGTYGNLRHTWCC